MSHEKIDRNKEILFKHRQGKTYSELAYEYQITPTRVRQIAQHERTHQQSIPYRIPEIEQACQEHDASDGMYYRILNALHDQRLDTHNKWTRLSRGEMMSIRNIGEKAADILEYAQKIAR